MPEPARFSLLASFADFYEEVAAIKLAANEARLAAYLGLPDSPAPDGMQLARCVSGRLGALLRNSSEAARRDATLLELKAYRAVQLVMVAVADEVLVLDLAWPGKHAWLACLLELQLFQTSSAGSTFFDAADRLVAPDDRHPLHAELAAVFLLALQLGFKGRCRGVKGAAALQQYRQQLFRLARVHAGATPLQPAFAQAYEHCLVLPGDPRMAPLGPWLRGCLGAGAAFLAVSLLVWLMTMDAFLNRFSNLLTPA